MTSAKNENNWFIIPKAKPFAKQRLICLPYAGGGANIYFPWNDYLPETVELVCIQLPGRGSRILERPFSSMEDLVMDLYENIQSLLDKPYILFGHSMGGRIGYQLLNLLEKRKKRLPEHFIASGSRAPHLPRSKEPIHQLPKNEFIAELKSLGGTQDEFFDNTELVDLFMPVLRADFKLAEQIINKPALLHNLPVSLLGGIDDNEVSYDEVKSWKHCFSKIHQIAMFDGGHFFIESNRALVLQWMVNCILQRQYN